MYFPDPVAFFIGPFPVYWYGLSYVGGMVGGWYYVLFLCKRYSIHLSKKDFDDYMTWLVISVIVGGRLGHVIFFQGSYYFDNPHEILMTWKGGMSFHGGLLGVVVASLIFCRQRHIPTGQFADLLVSAAPIGLGLGRISNFINQELYGRITDVPWSVVFPAVDALPRHPSQLYEAFLEGLVLWAVLFYAWRFERIRQQTGTIFSLFLMGYGFSRFMVEFVRTPDGIMNLGPITLTTGQVLCLPMIACGCYLLIKRLQKAVDDQLPL